MAKLKHSIQPFFRRQLVRNPPSLAAYTRKYGGASPHIIQGVSGTGKRTLFLLCGDADPFSGSNTR